jgi:hypothetical protein
MYELLDDLDFRRVKDQLEEAVEAANESSGMYDNRISERGFPTHDHAHTFSCCSNVDDLVKTGVQ